MDIKFNKKEIYKKKKPWQSVDYQGLEYPRRDLNPHAKRGTGF